MWLLHFCRLSLLHSIRSCPLWARPIFVPMAMHNFAAYIVSFRVTCWNFHSLLHKFCFFFSSFPVLHQLQSWSQLQQNPVSLQFLPHDVVIATDVMPNQWAFYFQGSGLHLSFSCTWSDSMLIVHMALGDLQTVVLMLHRMAFHFISKVVALYLDNSTQKPIYVIRVVEDLFSFQTSLPHFENGSQTWYYSSSSIHNYPSKCGNWLPIMMKVSSRVA